MNETTLGSQPIAAQRHLPQSSQGTDTGMQAKASQPVPRMLALPALTMHQDKAGFTLLGMPGHQARIPPQAGPESVTSGPRLSPPKAEPEPDSPARWPAKQSSDERDEERVGGDKDSEESSGEAETESDSLPEWLAELSPNARDQKWLRAAGGLNESLIQTMLASKLVDVNARNKDGKTGLHLAIQEGDPDIIRLLLGNARIDINARDGNRRTALHLAVMDYAYESVFDLAGCSRTDVNAEDEQGWTALR